MRSHKVTIGNIHPHSAMDIIIKILDVMVQYKGESYHMWCHYHGIKLLIVFVLAYVHIPECHSMRNCILQMSISPSQKVDKFGL